MNNKIKWGGIIAIIVAVIAAITGATININVENGKYNASIEYSEEDKMPEVDSEIVENVPEIEYGQGGVEVDGEGIKTVESVESNSPVTDEIDDEECGEGEECGRGAAYPKLNISSPQAFANDVLGKCIDVDGHFGSQCWDEMAAFWLNYTGRTLSTCGTGAAKGTIADGCWQKNAGNEFAMIWDAKKIQPGDIAIFSSGKWGHTGMVMGYYNNGYFTLLGQNQGAAACPGGGAAGNIINISARDFIGAFRPNIYIKPEPKPTPAPAPKPKPVLPNTITYTYVKGDYFSKVLKKLGLDEGNLWGKDGTVAYYTLQLVQQKVLDSRGNVKIGVPFTLIRR